MALFGSNEQELSIVVRLRDEASKQLEAFQGKVKSLEPDFKRAAAVGVAGMAAIGVAIGASVKESMEAEAAFNRLNHILKTSRGATDEQVQSLMDQADALERVGVVAADNITQTQAQLATFDLSAAAIEKLTPAILDYVVAEKGAAATTDDFRSMTNGLAQALQGNFASLTKTGFVLDDATKALIENGTEAERAAALVDVLNSTYEGFNAAARDTAEGALQVMNNEFNNLKQTIGDQFLPIIKDLATSITPLVTKLADWIKANPELARNIIIVTGALFGLMAVVGTLGLIIGPLAAGIAFLTGPIGLVILAIAALTAAGIWLYKNWEDIKGGAMIVWEAITTTLSGFLNAIADFFTKTWNAVKDTTLGVFKAIGDFFKNAAALYVGIWAMFLDWLVPGWDEALVALWHSAVEKWNQIKQAFMDAAAAIGQAVSAFMQRIAQIIQPGLDFIKQMWVSVWGGISAFFIGLWQPIKNAISSVIDFIVRQIERAINLYEKLKNMLSAPIKKAGDIGGSVVNSVSSFLSSAMERGKNLLGFEMGGIVPGPRGMPVPIMAHGQETILPAGQSRGAGGDVSISITLQNPTFRSREDADYFKREIDRALRDVMRVHKLSVV